MRLEHRRHRHHTAFNFFAGGVNDNFCCTEELVDMMSLKGTTTGGNIFDAVSEAVEKMGLKWDKPVE